MFTDVVGESLMRASHAEALAGLAIEAIAAIVVGIGAVIRAVPAGPKENDDERLRHFE